MKMFWRYYIQYRNLQVDHDVLRTIRIKACTLFKQLADIFYRVQDDRMLAIDSKMKDVALKKQSLLNEGADNMIEALLTVYLGPFGVCMPWS